VALNETQTFPDNDFGKLTQLKALSWLSPSELGLLASSLVFSNFKRPQIMLRDPAFSSAPHILLKGIARITCQNARSERVTIALLPPGPLPEFPSLPLSGFDFRCEAYNDCRVGSLSWNDFKHITVNSSELAYRKFHQNDLQQWYRLLVRNSSFLDLDLHQRIAITLLELASDFGIKESRGALLRTTFSHQDIADLVGASRPRVTEHLAQFEREHVIIRQGRQLIVCTDSIVTRTNAPLPSMDNGVFGKAHQRNSRGAGWRKTAANALSDRALMS
jgi:CRP/FNR family cyclic AMP-dependent transcriptional regulator